MIGYNRYLCTLAFLLLTFTVQSILPLALKTRGGEGTTITYTFDSPILIGEDIGVYADGMSIIAPNTLVIESRSPGKNSPPYMQSLDNGATWIPLTNPLCSALNGIVGVPVHTSTTAIRNYGKISTMTNGIYTNYTAFRVNNATVFSVPPSVSGNTGTGIQCSTIDTDIQFLNLPHPVTCKLNFGGCPFRLEGGDLLALPTTPLTYLYSTIVYWAGIGPWNTSIVGFRSTDGGNTFTYLGPIANSTSYLTSDEGPNENSLTLLSDNRTILCLFRMDAGDGPATHSYKNYELTFSQDNGLSWNTGTYLPNGGCARPRMYHLGNTNIQRTGGVVPAPLLLSGGRWRDHNTSDILLWSNYDGLGIDWDDPLSITGIHNMLVTNKSWKFDSDVNRTSDPRETTSYTSIVPLDNGYVPGSKTRYIGLSYNKHNVQSGSNVPDMYFFLRMNITWE